MEDIINQSLDGNWKIAVINNRDFTKMAFPLSYDAVINTRAAGAIVIDAKVPGNFEIDLEKAGIIPDPFFGTNILKM